MSSCGSLLAALCFLAVSVKGGSAALFQKRPEPSRPLTINIVNNYYYANGGEANRPAAVANVPVGSLSDAADDSQSPSLSNPGKSIGHVDRICPLGWMYFDGTRKCFKVFEQSKSWNESRANCEQYGARLASITNEEENSFVIGIALPLISNRNINDEKEALDDGLWIGLQRNRSESQCCHFGTCPDAGCFVGDWEDGRRVRVHAKETSWVNMWPEGKYPKEYEDCIRILVANPSRTSSVSRLVNKWLGHSCYSAVRGHICERNVE